MDGEMRTLGGEPLSYSFHRKLREAPILNFPN